MPRRQKIKLTTGRGVRGRFFGLFTDTRTGERYRTYGLRFITRGGISKVKPYIRRVRK